VDDERPAPGACESHVETFRPALDAALFFPRSHATLLGVSPLAGSREFALGGAL